MITKSNVNRLLWRKGKYWVCGGDHQLRSQLDTMAKWLERRTECWEASSLECNPRMGLSRGLILLKTGTIKIFLLLFNRLFLDYYPARGSPYGVQIGVGTSRGTISWWAPCLPYKIMGMWDLFMDIVHLKYPLVLFGSEGSALTLVPFKTPRYG